MIVSAAYERHQPNNDKSCYQTQNFATFPKVTPFPNFGCLVKT